MRLVLIALVVALLALDLARTGSDEFSCRAEIARAEEEIGILRRHCDDLRVGTQVRLFARVRDTEIDPGAELSPLELTRRPTPWERAVQGEETGNRAYAIEKLAPPRGWRLGDWLRAREGGIDVLSSTYAARSGERVDVATEVEIRRNRR